MVVSENIGLQSPKLSTHAGNSMFQSHQIWKGLHHPKGMLSPNRVAQEAVQGTKEVMPEGRQKSCASTGALIRNGVT
jgi:hypothetical protein